MKPLSFSNKKAAKQYAAKQAIDWLIENKHMPDNGAVKFPKSVPLPQVKKVRTPDVIVPPSTPKNSVSWASQVPDLCHRLGFHIPTYRLDRPIPSAPLWDAYADFGGDPRIDGRVGVVTGIYGQKKAKEESAKEVVSFLKDIERQRTQQFEDEDRKRNRSTDSQPQRVGEEVKVGA